MISLARMIKEIHGLIKLEKDEPAHGNCTVSDNVQKRIFEVQCYKRGDGKTGVIAWLMS